MFDRLRTLLVLPNLKIHLPMVFLLCVIASVWRYWSLMPHVFFGDDLMYLLNFKDGKCGVEPSELLTTVCYDKFRPVASGFNLLLMKLFDSVIMHYMAVNILLHATSATLVFAIVYRLSKGSLIASLSIAIAVATSRFAVYQVTQMVGGALEGLALPIFLGVIYAILRGDERREDTLWWSWIAIFLYFLLIHTLERYIVIAAWLAVAFVLLPNFRELPKKHVAAFLGACVALPAFNVAYKILVLNIPFLVGTGGTQLNFEIKRTLLHFGQAVLSIAGFNMGPEYLIGARMVSLQWFPAWFLASVLAISVLVSILSGIREVLVKLDKPSILSICILIRWPILLVLLALLLLAPPILTIRLEQRWLFASFILMLLVCAWAAGQYKNKLKVSIAWLIVIISASSILLDSVIKKHFDNVFFVSSARFAEIAKRDIADKYPGQTWGIQLLANRDQCHWSLLSGNFFRIYGGQRREIKCISLNDYPKEGSINSEEHVFVESSIGHLSDITAEWQAKIRTEHGKVLFDFIKLFSSGQINNSDKVDTPSGKGVLILPSKSVFGIENTITILTGFSYRFNDVLIEQDSQLRFGLSMIYPAEPLKAVVYVYEQNSANPKVLFSRAMISPHPGEKPSFSPVSIPLTAYAGKRVSLMFAAEPISNNTSAQWLGYSNPQIILPKSN